MQTMRSSMSAARGSQLKRELMRCQAQSPCWSPMRSMHSSRNPNSALMSEACRQQVSRSRQDLQRWQQAGHKGMPRMC